STTIALTFLFTHPATTATYTLSLHDALPISRWLTREPSTGKLWRGEEFRQAQAVPNCEPAAHAATVSHEAARLVEEEVRQVTARSEEHTSELQSRGHLVCRLLLEKKKYLVSV